MSSYQAKRRKPSASRRSEPRVPAWVWLFTGAILGAFIMFLMRLADMKQDQPPVAQKEKTPNQTEEKKEKVLPRFDFYEMLKNNKIEVPDFNNSEEPGENPQQAKQEFDYLLQVASFRDKDDAEQLMVELLLLNLEATREKAKVKEGGTWHRVIVGPFESRSKLAKARSTLLSNNYDALLLKRPKDASE